MTYLAIDIETFSDISLKDCGVYRYVDTPNFKILLLAYAFDDEPVQIIDLASGDDIPERLKNAILSKSITKAAFNAQFERVCLQKHFGRALSPESWECTMVKAATLGIPGGLDSVSRALGFPIDKQKLFTGKSLIRLFSIPRKATKSAQISMLKNKARIMPEDRPEEWEQFKKYCVQDVVVEREIRKRLSKYPTPKEEALIWQLDQKINDFGVRLDLPFVKQAVKIDEIYTAELIERYQALGLENPKSVTELKGYLSKKLGREVKSITKATIPGLLKACKDIPEALEALEIRQEIAKTSVSKYTKMEDVICSDGRARGLLQFYGAGTGRWCLAEGSQVLIKTMTGEIKEKPIEAVTIDDKVWDGDNWVNHEGVVFSGDKDVIEWDGIVATPDHIVYVSDTVSMRLEDAKKRRLRLWKGNTPFTN